MRKRIFPGSSARVGGKRRRAKTRRSKFVVNNVDLRPFIFHWTASQGSSALVTYLAFVACARPALFGRLLCRMLDDELKTAAAAERNAKPREARFKTTESEPVRYETVEEVEAEIRRRGLNPDAIFQICAQLGSKKVN